MSATAARGLLIAAAIIARAATGFAVYAAPAIGAEDEKAYLAAPDKYKKIGPKWFLTSIEFTRTRDGLAPAARESPCGPFKAYLWHGYTEAKCNAWISWIIRKGSLPRVRGCYPSMAVGDIAPFLGYLYRATVVEADRIVVEIVDPKDLPAGVTFNPGSISLPPRYSGYSVFRVFGYSGDT